ncbi:MAG TPA: S9 family peptidase [Acidimicrobiia bacterium]|nr:S9 family peptidase [Acidimicrobiia bacterium]
MLGFRPEDVALLATASDPRLAPDGARVAYTITTVDLEHNRYASRVEVSSCDGSGDPVVLSGAGASAGLARWSPDGRRIAFTSHPVDDDQAVSEIHVVDASGGEPVVVCACPSSPTEIEWCPDGSSLGFVARDPDRERYGAPGEERKEKDMSPRRIERLFTRLDNEGWITDRPSRVFVVDAAASSQPRVVTDGPFEAGGLAWSPDGRRLAFASARHDTWDIDWALDLFVADLAGGAPQRVTTTGPVYALPAWSPDGARLACTRMPPELDGPWNGQVAVLDLDGSNEAVLTEAIDRNCSPYPASRGPQWRDDEILFMVETGGCAHLWRAAATRAGACEPIVTGERMLSGFDAAGDTIAFVAGAPGSLPDVFVVANGRETQITDVTAALRDAGRTIAEPTAFTASPAEGVDVDCWIIEPEHDPDERVPLLLNIHGGPFSHYGSRCFDEFQLEVGAGFGVLYCNPRGSASYSQDWGRAIRWPECETDPGSGWGGVDYDDVMACVDEALKRNDWIDPDRIGVLGGSYGGYMTSWIIGHSDRFAAAISERSVNNLLTLDHGSDIAGSFVSYVGVRHIDDPEPYLRQSPIKFVRAMNTPLLILHSEDDLRCPVNQAEELFVALRLLGRTPEFVRFPGEGHELSRSGAPRHRVQRADIVIDFFRRHLGTR